MASAFLKCLVVMLGITRLVAGAEYKPATAAMPLQSVRSFMYQIQGLEKKGAIEKLAATAYDLVVVEPTFTVAGDEEFDAAGMVAKLHAGKPGRLVIAYIDVGEAEKYRIYWGKDWKPPTKQSRGLPDFMLIPDPDGWSDNYPVAFWDPRWQQIIATGPDALVQRIMKAGFDGLYLDWIDGYQEPVIEKEAKRLKIEPAAAMTEWVITIRKAAQAVNPKAVIIAQNGQELIDLDKRYAGAIDAVGFEDTWFGGKADTKWGKPKGGDIPNKYKGDSSTAGRTKQYKKYLAAGKPVLTIDYCLKPDNAAKVYDESRKEGFIPLVTQVSLERITETPPPGLPK